VGHDEPALSHHGIARRSKENSAAVLQFIELARQILG
jgi:hypothetical protein